MTDKIFALRKALSHSERERRIFTNNGKTNIIQGGKVVESQQNVVELRKLILQWEALEKQKRKAVSNLNTELNITKLSFQKLNLGPKKSKDEELEIITNETNPVGFRFRSNGDIRTNQYLSKTALTPSVQAIKDQTEFRHLERLKYREDDEISGSSLVTPFGDSDYSDGPVKIDINEEIAKLEKTVKELSTDVLRRSNSKAAKQFLRAHSRDDHSSSYMDSEMSHYRQMHPDDHWAFLQSSTDYGRYSKTNRQLHKRHSVKSNCVACELRLKQNDSDKIQIKPLSKTCGRRWNIASPVKNNQMNSGSQWDMSYLESKMKRQAKDQKKTKSATYSHERSSQAISPGKPAQKDTDEIASTMTVDFCDASNNGPKVWSRSEHDAKSSLGRPKTAMASGTEVYYNNSEEEYQSLMQRSLLSSHYENSFDTLKDLNSEWRLKNASSIGTSTLRSKSQMSRRDLDEIRRSYKEKLVERARMDVKASDEKVNHFLMSLNDKENSDGKNTVPKDCISNGMSNKNIKTNKSNNENISFKKTASACGHSTFHQKVEPRVARADDLKKRLTTTIKPNQRRTDISLVFQSELSKKRRKPLTLAESFQELKYCRYLRNPSKASVAV